MGLAYYDKQTHYVNKLVKEKSEVELEKVGSSMGAVPGVGISKHGSGRQQTQDSFEPLKSYESDEENEVSE